MSSTSDSKPGPEPLDLDALPSARGAAAEELERNRPGGLPYADYFRFLLQFRWSESQLGAIPLASGPRFKLD